MWGNRRFRRRNILRIRSDCEQRNVEFQEELQKEIEGGDYAISALGEDTEEWEWVELNLVEQKRELSKKIELRSGLGAVGD